MSGGGRCSLGPRLAGLETGLAGPETPGLGLLPVCPACDVCQWGRRLFQQHHTIFDDASFTPAWQYGDLKIGTK